MNSRYSGGGGCTERYGAGDGGGGCIARYAGGGCGFYDMSMVDRIMLKFRPIAPKPVTSGSGSGGSTAEDGGKKGRRKRRYVRVNSNSTVFKKRKTSTSSSQAREAVSGGDAMVTLSLMPETPDRKERSPVLCSPVEKFDIVDSVIKTREESTPIWLSFKNKTVMISPAPAKRQQVVSFVTVECVTAAMMDGCTDEERVRRLKKDTCPGFISDGGERVVWTNKAYRDMAGGEEVETVVMVVRKEGKSPAVYFPAAFTCKVRVTCRSGMTSRSTLTVPCDVWRMDGGGYAWRLDVKAALSLGR